MASPSASLNGGLIGKTNTLSFGKNTIQVKTGTGCFTATQPGTREITALIVAGGGGANGVWPMSSAYEGRRAGTWPDGT